MAFLSQRVIPLSPQIYRKEKNQKLYSCTGKSSVKRDGFVKRDYSPFIFFNHSFVQAFQISIILIYQTSYLSDFYLIRLLFYQTLILSL